MRELCGASLRGKCTELCTELYQSSAKALHEAPQKLYQSSTKGFAAPLPTQCTGHAVNGVRSAQEGLRDLPLEAPLEALLEALLETLLEALLEALYGAPKLY